jgi:hypothetical protein
MARTSTLTVRPSGALSAIAATDADEDGALEHVGAEIHDLIRRDKARASRETFDRLKAELNRAFAAAEDGYRPLTATEVIIRNRT